MKFSSPISINKLINQYSLELICNNADTDIKGLDEIHKVEIGDLTFVDTPKYYSKVLASKATFILINEKIDCPKGKSLIYSKNPFKTYNQIAKDYFPTQLESEKLISDTATIGKNTIIHPNVSLGNNVVIGDNCIIYPNVTIYSHTKIGNNVIIHSNSAIGSDAFYYNNQEGKYLKMHTIGKTIIEDNVEIGSNCSIDSGVSGITRIGNGTKLDNQIHIAHGVEIGSNCLLCAQVAIAGKTTIGNNVILYGKVGVSKGLTIGDNSIILGASNVNKDLEGNQKYYGSPAVEARQAMKYFASMKLLPDMMYKLRHLIHQESEIDK